MDHFRGGGHYDRGDRRDNRGDNRGDHRGDHRGGYDRRDNRGERRNSRDGRDNRRSGGYRGSDRGGREMHDRRDRRDDRRDGRRDDRGYRGDRGGDRGGFRGRNDRGGGSTFGGRNERRLDPHEDRGRPIMRREASKTPSRTPSYSPVHKNRPSQWDQTIAKKSGDSGNVNQANPQQLSQRRLYVGNVPESTDEEELVNFFNNAMIRANLVTKPGEPVIAASIYREKGYAFIELRSSEEATSGLEFNGINIHGNPLKVSRPNDYKAPLKSDYVSATSEANINLVSSNVAETDFKIYVGGLPSNISEDKIKKLLSYFGDLRSFNLVRDPGTQLSKGFAFCEYMDHDVTDYACLELNGMAVGDKTLVVQRASINPKNMPQFNQTPVEQPLVPSAASMLNLSRPAATLLAGAIKNATEGISKILVLLNIVNMVDFPGDEFEEDYQLFVDSLMQEAMKYGNVKSILVPRNPFKRKPLNPLKVRQSDHTIERYPYDMDSTSDDDIDTEGLAFQKEIQEALDEEGEMDKSKNVDGFGKVFIEYATLEESKYAMRALSGRRYNGRMVITMYLEEEKWKNRELEPPHKHEIISAAAELDQD